MDGMPSATLHLPLVSSKHLTLLHGSDIKDTDKRVTAASQEMVSVLVKLELHDGVFVAMEGSNVLSRTGIP